MAYYVIDFGVKEKQPELKLTILQRIKEWFNHIFFNNSIFRGNQK